MVGTRQVDVERGRRGARTVIAGLLALVLIAGACQQNVRAGGRCRTTDFGDGGTHVLRCVKGRWQRAATRAQIVELVRAILRSRTTTTTIPRPRPTVPVSNRAQADKTAVFAGLGAWVDVYDWSPTYDPTPSFVVDSVTRLADAGVQVLYIQSGKAQQPADVLDIDRFTAIVGAAKARGLRVVSWYLSSFLDRDADVRKLTAPLAIGVDGIAMDIESTEQRDVAARNDALRAEAQAVRTANPDLAIVAIVLPPVVTDVLNLNYWPDFPWEFMAPLFDAWMPMGYWTNRTVASGWRDGERYTNENIDRVRSHLGDPNAPVHPVGGIANQATADEVAGYVRSAQSRGAIGGSLYDDHTSNVAQYVALQPLRR